MKSKFISDLVYYQVRCLVECIFHSLDFIAVRNDFFNYMLIFIMGDCYFFNYIWHKDSSTNYIIPENVWIIDEY